MADGELEKKEPGEDDDELGLVPADEEEAPLSLTEPAEPPPPPSIPFVEPEDAASDELPSQEPTVPFLEESPPEGPSDEPSRALEREEPPPPSLEPATPIRLLIWPLRGANASGWLTVFGLSLPVLAFTGLLPDTPYVGKPLFVLINLGVASFLAAYPFQVVLASLQGRGYPPAWPRFSPDTTTRAESHAVLLLLALLAAPAALAGLLVGAWLALPLAAAGLALLPASLLCLATGGSIRFASPFPVLSRLEREPRRYLYCLVPGGVLLPVRLLAPPGLASGVLDALILPALIYTALLVGTLAREHDELSRHLLDLAARRQEEEERMEAGWERDLEAEEE